MIWGVCIKSQGRTYKKNLLSMPGKSLTEVLSLVRSAGINLEAGVEASFAKCWKMSLLSLPACALEVNSCGCQGICKADGLYLQCSRKVDKNGFCKWCENNMVSEGRPKTGLISERVSVPRERFSDGVWRTEEGKKAITWMQYLKKKGLSREDGEKFLESKGVDSLPDSEWELPVVRRGRRSAAASDTSSEGGEKPTARFLAVDGKRKSPPKENAHVGKDGKTRLRVKLYRDSGIVVKCNIANWTDEANAKFAELYCKGVEGLDEGEEFGSVTKKKKKDAAQDQLAEMQAMLEKMAAENAALKAAAIPLADVNVAGETKSSHAEEAKKKKAKMEALKKAKAEKKAKVEAEKKAKAEALKAQLAALEQQEDELGEFDDSDDEGGQEFNPYEYNGISYHLDDENQLYTKDGEYFGHIEEDGTVVPEDAEEDA